jgi:hypothetical protein
MSLGWLIDRQLHRQWGLLCVLCSGALVAACIVGDGEDRCDKNQVFVGGDAPACLCAENTIMDPRGYGCVPCGANEVVTGAACACASGFARATPSAACEPVVGQELGAACTGEGTCRAPYPYCATDGADKYCTVQGCGATTPCPTSYRCEQGFCAKVTGLGKACSSPADCAGTDAVFCNTFAGSTCVVQGCAADTSLCPAGSVCCAIAGNSSCAVGASCPPPTMRVP